MKTATASCTKCDKTFTKPTLVLAEAALRMHVGRKHERNIIANHEHSGVLRQRANGSLSETEKPKRKYTRRQKVEQHVHVNFCPNCGCNIHAVATGIAMAARV